MLKLSEDDLDWFKTYLGEKNYNILKGCTKEDILFLNKIWKTMNLSSSYFVLGTSSMLDKFKVFYLSQCNAIKEVRKYEEFMFSEYARYLTGTNEDDIGIPEILFIRAHGHSIGYGKTEDWLSAGIIDNIANRRIKGYVTLILSERIIDPIVSSKEVETIDLTKGLICKVKKENNFNNSNNEYL